MHVPTFGEAYGEASAIKGSIHLLIGNGFSIACRPDCFTYGRLFDEADFSAVSVSAVELFAKIGTTDFEQVIQVLRLAAVVAPLYADDPRYVAKLTADADAIKSALASVLAANHPDDVGKIEPQEYSRARAFLARFDGNLYSLNYDLLLYWALLHDDDIDLASDDGFRADPDDTEAEWVTWDGFANHRQRVFFLHGGLHLFDAGASIKKLTWSRTGVPLLAQIREALSGERYPIVVTEGSSDEKLRRIEHSPYLHRGLKSMTACGGCLFIYGHSLAENDEHILRRIEQGKFTDVFVGLYDDPDSETNVRIRRRAGLLAERRSEFNANVRNRNGRELHVHYFDSGTTPIWSETSY